MREGIQRAVILCSSVVFLFVLHTQRGYTEEEPHKTVQESNVITVTMDPRVEFMTIAFRLAGNSEYNQGRIGLYIQNVDTWFEPYTDHDFVLFCKELRTRRGIAYDAPMSLAVHLTDSMDFLPRIPFEPHPPTLDGRWTPEDLARFLKLARDFAAQSDFDGFFASQSELHELTVERLRARIASDMRLEWFDHFFGSRPGSRFIVIPSIVNGPSCYGMSIHTDDGEELYSVLGVWGIDDEGLPEFHRDAIPGLVHEFAHSYCNPLIDVNLEQLESAGERIFMSKEKQMKQMAYGSGQTVLYETLVRATTIRYFMQHGEPGESVALGYADTICGFTWIPDMVDLLGEYESNRERYPTLSSFMPEIVQFLNEYAESLP